VSRATATAEREPLEQTTMPFMADVAFAHLSLESLSPSRTNPRGKHEREALADLVESIRKQGVLMPVLVRPLKPGEYELVAGHRRFEAAKLAMLSTIPATVRELSDVEVLEIQVVENLQRADLTPLEEAEGYRRLLRAPGYDVEKIAERVGRSIKYVYDRVKLLALSKDAQALLLEEKITAGHAILLARLSPADQKRAMAEGALLEREHTLFDPDDDATHGQLKARSVREFAGWIDEHVRFEPVKVDPVLFPETAARLEEKPKVVPVTYLRYISEEARDGRTFFPQSWKRADGREDSKTCEYSTLGYVAVGPRRGEAFEVCTEKTKCVTHWGTDIRDRKKRVTAAAASPAKPSKADSPEVAARKAAIERAVRDSEVKAREEFDSTLGAAAAALAPEDFIRVLALVCWGDIATHARDAGEKLEGGKVKAWIARAPVAQLQRFYAAVQCEFYEELAEILKVDRGAIYERHANEAREAVKVQTSAQKVSKPKKPAKKAKA
jgi:ParB/RepB/Spo0J family partition protein